MAARKTTVRRAASNHIVRLQELRTRAAADPSQIEARLETIVTRLRAADGALGEARRIVTDLRGTRQAVRS